MVGISKQPMRFILLEFERMQKAPMDAPVIRTVKPRKFENIKVREIKTTNVTIDNSL